SGLKMNNLNHILNQHLVLRNKYKQLIEQAYNLREIDAELSDISAFNAMKLLNKLNKFKYFHPTLK
ncbi:Lacal_2735 family protein, partial [Aegicerativicinus sediminis]